MSDEASVGPRGVGSGVWRRTWIYWVVASALVVCGVGITVLSFLLPEEPVLPRALATAMGSLLVAIAGLIVSYVMTKETAVRETEQHHNETLSRIAHMLAHIHSNLQSATDNRRSGAYAEEETYQVMVLSTAQFVLTEFDAIIRKNGSIQGAFRESKKDLDEVQSVLYSPQAIQQTMTATKFGTLGVPQQEEVTVRCPRCGARTKGQLGMRPGWTARLQCTTCKASFNTHRRGDLTVITSNVLDAPSVSVGRNTDLPKVAEAQERAAAQRKNTKESPAIKELKTGEGQETASRIGVQCPGCHVAYTVSYTAYQLEAVGVLPCICFNCATRYKCEVATKSVTEISRGKVHPGAIESRQTSFFKLRCPRDETPLVARYPALNGDWHAFCPRHRMVVGTTRALIREWLAENDPDYLTQRLELEESGGTRKISDLLP